MSSCSDTCTFSVCLSNTLLAVELTLCGLHPDGSSMSTGWMCGSLWRKRHKNTVMTHLLLWGHTSVISAGKVTSCFVFSVKVRPQDRLCNSSVSCLRFAGLILSLVTSSILQKNPPKHVLTSSGMYHADSFSLFAQDLRHLSPRREVNVLEALNKYV